MGVNWRNAAITKGRVPDVTGMTFRDALFLLESHGLRVSYEGQGRVVRQSIVAGSLIGKGGNIYLKLG
jgi:cell division protein FtsI (penicillin-binding protein 3)